MPTISIIVPVYNAGKYLKEAMTCIVEQTMRDIEIICINDSSTDDSLHILEQFAEKDKRVRIISNSSNQGAAISRNRGMNIAQGKYICFLDADDIFAKDMVEKEYEAICRYHADVAVAHSADFKENRQEWKEWEFPWEEQCVSMKKNTTGRNLLYAWNVVPWNKMYKKEFIEKYHLSYQNLSSSNDVFFGVMAVLLAKRIALVGSDNPLILYRTGIETQISANRISMNAYLAFEAIHDSMIKWNLWEKYFESFFDFFCYGIIGEFKCCNNEIECRKTYEYIAKEGLRRVGFFEISANRFKNKKLYKDLQNYLNCSYDSGWFLESKRNIKVLYISNDAQLYDAQKSLLECVKNLREKDIEPLVLMPCKGELQNELDRNKIENMVIPYYNCIYSGNYHFTDYVKYLWTNVNALRKIKRLIKEKDIKFVHTNTLTVDIGAIAAYLSKIPHIWHFREYVEEDSGYKRLYPKITAKLVRKSRYCISVSEGIRRKYRKKYGVDSLRLYDALESSAYFNSIDADFCTENTAELLLAGTICERKGQRDAIRAIKILVEKGVNVHLTIVEDGEAAFIRELKVYARKRGLMKYITFHAHTHSLHDLEIQSDIILVCSGMEAFGRVTAEAMMAGKIVIASKSGDVVELIGINEERGYLYPYGHPEKLADKIQYILTNKEEVLEKEKQAQKFIMDLTDMERYTERLVQIYRK